MMTFNEDVVKIYNLGKRGGKNNVSADFAQYVDGYSGLYKALEEEKLPFRVKGRIDSIVHLAFQIGVEFEKNRVYLEEREKRKKASYGK